MFVRVGGNNMTHAEKCPVCWGSGKVAGPPSTGTAVIDTGQTCHGCGGRGWVEVQDQQYIYPYG